MEAHSAGGGEGARGGSRLDDAVLVGAQLLREQRDAGGRCVSGCEVASC